jgi:hypothetical protein
MHRHATHCTAQYLQRYSISSHMYIIQGATVRRTSAGHTQRLLAHIASVKAVKAHAAFDSMHGGVYPSSARPRANPLTCLDLLYLTKCLPNVRCSGADMCCLACCNVCQIHSEIVLVRIAVTVAWHANNV